jgi:hypothetical protein
MKGISQVPQADPRGSQRVITHRRLIVYSLVASSSVLLVSLLVQWFVYDDWLHETGPIHVVGTTLAAVLTFGFVLHWQLGLRRQHAESMRRFQIIAEMNDRIRNQLQAIECVMYARDQGAMKEVAEAVKKIDSALQGVVAVTAPRETPEVRKPSPPKQVDRVLKQGHA